MPRHVTKTYGRQPKASSCVFDEAVRGESVKVTASQTSSTIRKWGETSFTSKRSNPVLECQSVPRKRKSEENDLEFEGTGSGSGGEGSLFDDPFSFDSGDDSPKKPKKGMGFKVEKKAPAASKPTYRILSTKNNRREVSSFKKTASNITYTQVGKPTLPKAASATLPARTAARKVDNQQLTMDSFTIKMTKKSSSMPVAVAEKLVSPIKISLRSSSPVVIISDKEDTDKEDDTDTEDLEARWEKAVSSESTSRKFFTKSEHDYSQPVSISSDGESAAKDDHSYSSQDSSSSRNESKDSNELFQSPDKLFPSPEKRPLRKMRLARRTSPLCDDTFTVITKKKEKTDSAGEVAKNTLSTAKSSDSESASSSSSSNGLRKMKKIELKDKEDRQQAKKVDEPLVRRLLTSPKKKESRAKASYNPRQWHGIADEPSPGDTVVAPSRSESTSKVFDSFDDETDPVAPIIKLKKNPVMRRAQTDPGHPWKEPSTKVTVSKESKPLFKIVTNVKHAHECLEHGETQEFQDDLEYIMPGLQDTQPTPTRCLSTMSLATKCIAPAFRMHLKAHGIIMEILKVLHNAADHAPLALCVSAFLFMNSRDRMVMDLERPALALMLQLLSADSMNKKHVDVELEKTREKVTTILETFRKEGNVKDFVLEEVGTGFLAMETLLSLTSKKAGDWFKEEVRTLGGLDHIVNTVTTCVDDFDEISIDPTPAMLERCRKLNRCLRVLENVTYLNSDNQTYLVTYKSAAVIKSLYKAVKSCENCLPFNEVELVGDKMDESCPGFVLYTCLLANLRVLLNITHENLVGATRVGQMAGFISTLLSIILRLPQFIPANHRFDLLVLGLGLLINLVEDCDHNQRMLLESCTSTPFEHKVKRKVEPLEALCLLFLLRLEAAEKFEQEHDKELDEKNKRKDEKKRYGATYGSSQSSQDSRKSGQWKESDSGLEWVMDSEGKRSDPAEEEEAAKHDDLDLVSEPQEEQEDLTQALHKAGKHMEDSLIAAYVSLLVGCLVQHHSHLAEKARGYLPDQSFDSMIRMLKKFLGFMNFTSAISGNTGSKSIMRVIEILEASNC